MENCIENIREMLETTADSREINEISDQLKRYQAELMEARAEGDQDQTRYLEGRISSLQAELGEHRDGKEENPEVTGSIGEISFGSRKQDLARAEALRDSYSTKVDTYTKHVESDIRFNRDTRKSMSDLRYAQKRYADACKEVERLEKLDR